jgi:hypothetical protein
MRTAAASSKGEISPRSDLAVAPDYEIPSERAPLDRELRVEQLKWPLYALDEATVARPPGVLS